MFDVGGSPEFRSSKSLGVVDTSKDLIGYRSKPRNEGLLGFGTAGTYQTC